MPFFWLPMAVKSATGQLEFSGRLVAMLFALGAVLMTFAVARRWAGNLAGLIAGAMLASCAYFYFFGRYYRMDMPFASSIWCAIGCYALTLGGEISRLRRGLLWMGFYACWRPGDALQRPGRSGLAGGAVLCFLLVARQWRELRSAALWALPGLAVYLAIAAPWYVLVAVYDRDYFWTFFVVDNFQRFLGQSVAGHAMPAVKTFPAILYLPLLLGDLMPWTIYLPGAIVRTLRFKRRLTTENTEGTEQTDKRQRNSKEEATQSKATRRLTTEDTKSTEKIGKQQRNNKEEVTQRTTTTTTGGERPANSKWRLERFFADEFSLLLWAAVLVPLIFFMISHGRMVGYILPCVPPLAALTAIPVAQVGRRHEDKLYDLGAKIVKILLPVLAVCLLVVELVLPKAFAAVDGEHLTVAQWLSVDTSWLDAWIVVPIATALLAALLMQLARGDRPRALAAAFVGWACVLVFASLHTLPRVADHGNCRDIASWVASQLPADAKLVCFQCDRLSFPLYAGRLEALQVRPDHPDELTAAREILASGKPVFALVPDAPGVRKGKWATAPEPPDPAVQLQTLSARAWTPVAAGGSFSVWCTD